MMIIHRPATLVHKNIGKHDVYNYRAKYRANDVKHRDLYM